MMYTDIFKAVRAASRRLTDTDDAARSAVIRSLADILAAEADGLIAANALDLERMDPGNPLYDRLLLTPARIDGIVDALRHVASLPCPAGETVEHRTLPNGLDLRRVRVPYGVIGVIFEARPNVIFDVFALCLKSGNACILKGGSDAEHSNIFAYGLICKALEANSLDAMTAMLLPSDHSSTSALLDAVGLVDLVIPRGGRRLIDFVRDNAHVPVIETGAGVVSTYFDIDGDLGIGRDIILNAKTRRLSVCNALDTLLIHSARLADLPALVAPLADKGVTLHADHEAFAVLTGNYPDTLLVPAVDDDWDREWMSADMGVLTVSGLTEAIAHINAHGSGHSEAIITENPHSAAQFQLRVDAACVYVNAPTSFTDGGEFGLGAEIGISTQKLGPRGPMGLTALTTTRWLITGHGQIRQ